MPAHGDRCRLETPVRAARDGRAPAARRRPRPPRPSAFNQNKTLSSRIWVARGAIDAHVAIRNDLHLHWTPKRSRQAGSSMYVCLCMAVTGRQILEAVDNGAHTVRESMSPFDVECFTDGGFPSWLRNQPDTPKADFCKCWIELVRTRPRRDAPLASCKTPFAALAAALASGVQVQGVFRSGLCRSLESPSWSGPGPYSSSPCTQCSPTTANGFARSGAPAPGRRRGTPAPNASTARCTKSSWIATRPRCSARAVSVRRVGEGAPAAPETFDGRWFGHPD